MAVITRMQQKRGTAAEWNAQNPILAAGEIGVEMDTGILKVGNGIDSWVELVPLIKGVLAPTAAEWASKNPILGQGEVGIERDTELIKIGDGITAWNNLPVVSGSNFETKVGAKATFAAIDELGVFPVGKYGNITQALTISDAIMAAGSSVLHSETHTFTADEIGMTIGVRGAGPISTDYTVLANDGVLVTTIASLSGGDAVLSHPATTTCVAGSAVFGFPIDSALVAANNAATAAGLGKILLPPGRWITTVTWNATPGNDVIGAGRDLTTIYFVHTGPGDDATASWYRPSGSAHTRAVNVSDFTMDGSYFVASGPTGSNMKMLQVTNCESSTVQRMRILNNPATAIGYDESRRLLLADNIIIKAGRLGTHGTGAGWSALGITVGNLEGPASCIIRNNFIDGGWLDDADNQNKHPHTGIHLEGIFTDSTDTGPAPQDAYVIEGNIITRCGIGIRDSGALGTIINGNRITDSGIGISLSNKGSSFSRMPRDTVITNNVIRDLVTGAGSNTTIGHGIQLNTALTTYTNHGRIIVSGNTISAAPLHGIYLFGSTTLPLRHVRIANNMISDCGQNGIHVRGDFKDLAIVSNSLVANGRLLPANPAAILIHNTVVWVDGRISGNSCTDYQSTPTQTSSVTKIGSPTLTNVFIGDNGDSYPALQNDSRLKFKGGTSTITSNTTLAVLSQFTIPVVAGESYEFFAQIAYTASVAGGLKLSLSLAADTTAAEWSVTGVNFVSSRLGYNSTTSLSGGSGTMVALVRGVMTVGPTGFNFGIQAAQVTADANPTVITTSSRLTLQRLSLI